MMILTKLGNIKSKFTSLNWDNAQFLRNNRLTQVTILYRFINIGLILFFYLILIFSLIFIIKKIIDQKRIENGILKANGFTSFNIACSYLGYGVFMSFVGSIVGYVVGVFAQIPTINVFNNYFIIPNKLEIGWDSFLINFFIIFTISFSIIFLISFLQVKQHPLMLINPNSKLTSDNLITKLVHKVKIKKFTRRFRLILLSVSIKNIALLFTVILIATVGITAASLIPTALFQISNDYFYNLNYKNKISYEGIIHNNPLTRYHNYFWKGPENVEKNNQYSLNENNVIPNYIYDYEYKNGIKSTDKKWIDIWNIDSKEIRYYQNTIQNAILYNFASTKGASFSLGLFKELSTRYHSDDLNYSISTLLCSIIPAAFGKNPIIFDNSKPFVSWNYCLSAATESLLPADIKQIWVSNPYRQDQFNFTFGTVAVNKTTDDLYTSYYSNINEKNVETIGITADNKTIKALDKTKLFKTNNDRIAVGINEYLNKVNHLNKGNSISANVEIPTLQYYSSKSKTYETVGNNKSFWYYNESDNIDNTDNLIDIEKNPLALNKLTLNNENNSLDVKFGFKNKVNKIQQYYKLSNIELFLPIDEIDPTNWDMEIRSDTTDNLLPKLFDTTSSLGKPKIVGKVEYLGKKYYAIKIYSSDYDYVINDPLSSFKLAPNTWYHVATSDAILKTAHPFLKINNIKKQVQYEVVQIHPSYDKPRIYMSINNANNVLNYSQATIDQLPLWYNGKFTQEIENYDQTAMYNNVPLNGNYNLNNFLTKQYVNAVNPDRVDHIGLKQTLLTKLAIISVNLTLVFILLMCMAGIIFIFIIIDAFLTSYLKFIVVLKTIVYSKKEVNSMTIAMFTPFIFVAWIIGLFLTWLVIRTTVIYYALKSQIVIPFGLPWYLIPISFAIVMSIYAVAYFILSNKISRLSIQKQINLVE